MYLNEPQARIGYRGGAISRAKSFALKGLVVVGGALMVASAFVVSMVFLAVGFAVVLVGGGYLWWKTRELRRQLRAGMQQPSHMHSGGVVIEGEAVEVKPTPRR